MHQDLYLLLKEPVGSWYQSHRTGSNVVLHSSSIDDLRINVQDTLKQLGGVKVVAVDVVQTDSVTYNALIKLNYNGRELEESFEIKR